MLRCMTPPRAGIYARVSEMVPRFLTNVLPFGLNTNRRHYYGRLNTKKKVTSSTFVKPKSERSSTGCRTRKNVPLHVNGGNFGTNIRETVFVGKKLCVSVWWSYGIQKYRPIVLIRWRIRCDERTRVVPSAVWTVLRAVGFLAVLLSRRRHVTHQGSWERYNPVMEYFKTDLEW